MFFSEERRALLRYGGVLSGRQKGVEALEALHLVDKCLCFWEFVCFESLSFGTKMFDDFVGQCLS